jgi:hypothetical protein
MIYSDLPAGATVFVDAGPFIHHFEPNAHFGPASTDFLERIENLAGSRGHGADARESSLGWPAC